MAGTSTIPTILAGETGYFVTIRWIDDNEKEYADSFRTKPNPSDAEIQALVDASQAGSNASSWKCEVGKQWEGSKNAFSAASAVHESVADKVRLSYKDISSGAYEQAYLPAPLEVLVGDNGLVDISQATYIAWKAALNAVVQSSFTALNTAFVQYSGRNESTSP